MSSHHDVIVVGIGSMGAAACLHLAQRGASVLGIDSQPVPNTNSSYNGNTRVIRLTYQEHPDYVPLLKEAYRLDEIEQEPARDCSTRPACCTWVSPMARRSAASNSPPKNTISATPS